MKLRLLDALKMFLVMVPAILLARYAADEVGLTSSLWQKPVWHTVVFAAVFSLGYTSYRKPKA
jgi:hypothetical protein